MISLRNFWIYIEALNSVYKCKTNNIKRSFFFLHICRKLTAEESARISTENQLQSEQAKASTAVVDADKYRCFFFKSYYFFVTSFRVLSPFMQGP